MLLASYSSPPWSYDVIIVPREFLWFRSLKIEYQMRGEKRLGTIETSERVDSNGVRNREKVVTREREKERGAQRCRYNLCPSTLIKKFLATGRFVGRQGIAHSKSKRGAAKSMAVDRFRNGSYY